MYDEAQEEVFLGRSAGTQAKSISGDTAQHIDEEVRRISDECYANAQKILEEHRDKLEMMAEALMTYETIDASQIDDIMAGRKPSEPANWHDDTPNGGQKAESSEEKPKPKDDPIGGPAGEH